MNDIVLHGHIDISYEGELVTYIISSIIDMKSGNLSMTNLDFYKNYGNIISEKWLGGWDNDEYLIDNLYNNVLIPWTHSHEITSPKEFAELIKIEGVSIDDFEGLKVLFDKAIEMKMFDEYFNNKK